MHEQKWKAKVDRPTFPRVKYIMITVLTIATLFASMFVRRHQMSCCMFPSFPAGSIVAFGTQRTLQQLCCFLPPHSAVQVEFFNNKDSFLRAAEILRAPTMCSRDILQQAKGDHLDWVHSVQLVLEMIRQGRLVQRSRSSAEAKSLKTRVKGTVRLPLQLDSSQGGQTGGQGAEMKGFSHRESTEGENWTTALNLPNQGKRQSNRKTLHR